MAQRLSLPRAATAAAVYLGGGALQRGLQLLLLPLLVGSLSPEEFTRYGLFVSLVTLLPIALTGNSHSAGPRLAFHHPRASWPRIFQKSVRLAFVPLLLTLAATWLFGQFIGAGRVSSQEAAAATVAITGSVLLQYALAVARVLGKPVSFGLAVTARALVTLGVYGLALLSGAGGYAMAAWAIASGYIAGGLVGYATADRPTGIDARSSTVRGEAFEPGYRDIAVFSYPTALNFFAMWLMNQGGRWIGSASLGLASIADYVLLVTVIGAAGMITRAVFDGELPNYSRHFAAGNWTLGIGSLGSAALLSMAGVTAAIGLLVWLGHSGGLPEGYSVAAPLLVPALFLCIIDVGYVAGIQILICTNRTREQAVVGVLAGFLALALSLVFVERWGELGLIVATSVGYATVTAGTWWRAWRTRP